ncbi:hypothetical protein [Spirosoma sp.]|uniref:hypothetical protein n=1 Tax=Spirosoma sp. TaxID=1899569 RepID=UPI00261710F3|nr:hypothetical protein [Spirosoma sp.]MCX6218328.1 hypothetical protein [Spirosoma sp.]
MKNLLILFVSLLNLTSFGQVGLPLSKPDPRVPTVGAPLSKPPTAAQSNVVITAPLSKPVSVTVNGAFTLATAARASLGAYKVVGADTILVRTLYSAVTTQPGTFTATWDGKDDYGNDVEPGQNYVLQLESNNNQYSWMGVLGNTSFNLSNPNQMHKGFRRIYTMYRVGSRMYYGIGYAEGHPSQGYYDISNPQVRNDFFRDGKTGQSTILMVSDGVRMYNFGYDVLTDWRKENWIFAFTVADNKEYIFTGGGSIYKTAKGQDHGETYNSALFVSDTVGMPNNTSLFKGGAVQKNGNYLFAALGANKNLIRVWHKTTGAPIRDIAFSSVGAMCVDVTNDNLLWAVTNGVLRQFTINADGSLTATGLTIPYLGKPMAMGISPDGSTLTVCDGDTAQKVKHYSTSTATLIASQGLKGGYQNDPNVTTNKFYFDDPVGVINDTYVAYEANGSYWIGDNGNFRAMHFAANRTYIEPISYLENTYTTGVDKNDPSRLFGQWLEFAVTDYDNPATAWTLVRNYRATVPTQYFENEFNRLQNVFQVHLFEQVATVNGHTYALIQRFTDKFYAVVELMPNAPLRFTGIYLGVSLQGNKNVDAWVILKDGSLAVQRSVLNGNGATSTFVRKQFLGIDGNNNPVWGAESTLQSVALTANDAFPVYGGSEPFAQTTNGTVITFNSSLFNPVTGAGLGYHLSGIKNNKVIWGTHMATNRNYVGPYPTDGAYDIGNNVNYGGGNVQTVGNDIYANYHGENWQGGQVNKQGHWSNIGLLQGSFGVTQAESQDDPVTNRGMAGNVFAITGVQGSNGNQYLVHGEEYGWSGLHLWKIVKRDNKRQVVTATVSLAPDPRGVPLFGGLPKNSILANGTAGLVRSPAADDGEYTVRTNALSYSKVTAPDFYFQNNNAAGDKFATVPFNSQTGLTSWKVSFTLQATRYYPSVGEYGQAGSGGGYIRILDNAGKTLVQYFQKISGSNVVMGFNGVTAYSKAGNSVPAYVPITITASGTNLICSYGSYGSVTVPKYDATATLTSPASIQVFSWVNGSNTGRIYGLLDGWFKAN